jgi:hypothetical protein
VEDCRVSVVGAAVWPASIPLQHAFGKPQSKNGPDDRIMTASHVFACPSDDSFGVNASTSSLDGSGLGANASAFNPDETLFVRNHASFSPDETPFVTNDAAFGPNGDAARDG